MSAVYGLTIEDPASRRQVQQILDVSLLMAFIALVSSILQATSGSFYSIGIMAGLFIPCCGYLGAMRRSKFLVACFTCWNLCLAFLFSLSFILSLALVGDYIGCVCNPACAHRHRIPASETDRICGNVATYRAIWWASMALAICMSALQLVGAYQGMRFLKTRHMVMALLPTSEEPFLNATSSVYPQHPPPSDPPITPAAPLGPTQQQPMYHPSAASTGSVHYSPYPYPHQQYAYPQHQWPQQPQQMVPQQQQHPLAPASHYPFFFPSPGGGER
jgi:hypothetical protein